MPLPNHKWNIKNPQPASNLLHSLVTNRRLGKDFLDPELMQLDPPESVFIDLPKAGQILYQAILNGESIGISGDYDVDGMTSTALLLRVFRTIGADATYAIPSRMGEGYGLNTRIVEEFVQKEVSVLITVDNGTCAFEPILRAKDLGLQVVVTDHHEPSPDGQLPMADAIINPKFVSQDNAWSQVSGVGAAFILGMYVAHYFQIDHEALFQECYELFALGTIADMVSLTGVNRRYTKRGLRAIPRTRNLGIQALAVNAGLNLADTTLRPEDIGFKLAPRINSVGRIGDPDLIIRLFSTDCPQEAMELAREVEELNKKRQEMVKEWKAEFLNWIDIVNKTEPTKFQEQKIIFFWAHGIHKGIVGLIANALVEKTGYPAFIGSAAHDGIDVKISGSCRGGADFNVHAALDHCKEHLQTYGGHKAAGGFSFYQEDAEDFERKLTEYANLNHNPKAVGKTIYIDQELSFTQISAQTYSDIQYLQPFGMDNFEPIFSTCNVRVVEQKRINYPGAVKFTFEKDGIKLKATGWDFEQYLPLPEFVDVAYKLEENTWNNRVNIELTLQSVKASS